MAQSTPPPSAANKDPNGTTFYTEPLVRPNYEIGRCSYHGNDLVLKTWIPGERIIIGNFCSISFRVMINVGGGHGADLVSTFPFDYFFLRRPKPHRTYRTTPNTVIGSDVWIGAGATILGGVNVGHGAIIGSCSVVATDVPAYAIVVGNPARVIRTRFNPAVIERLLRIEWWNWSTESVHERVEWFYRPMEEFLAEFDAEGGRGIIPATDDAVASPIAHFVAGPETGCTSTPGPV